MLADERRQRLAVIGGSGVQDFLTDETGEEELIPTPYGEALLVWKRHMGKRVAFLPRHGPGHRVPPHRINYRANVWALDLVGATTVIATAAVGGLVPDLEQGQLVFADQFLDFTKQRPLTFFEGENGKVRHTDVSEPYCPRIRSIGSRIARDMGLTCRPEGTYVCVEGPRFETTAEIRMYTMLGGHVIGMTNLPEVVLARELGLCYGLVTVVTNPAAGVVRPKVEHQGVLEAMRQVGPELEQLLRRMVEELDDDPRCLCRGNGQNHAMPTPPR